MIAAVTANGGSPITSYSIEVDYGSGFVPAIGDPMNSLDLQPIITSGVVSGTTYPVQYRARNIYGWSDYSPVSQIIASTIPSEPLNVVTQNVDLQSFITVSWDAVANTGGNLIPITEYRVFIQRVNGIDFNEPAGCIGTDADVVANRLCRVEM